MDDRIDWSRRHEAETRTKIVNTYYAFMIRLVDRKIRKLPACADHDAIFGRKQIRHTPCAEAKLPATLTPQSRHMECAYYLIGALF